MRGGGERACREACRHVTFSPDGWCLKSPETQMVKLNTLHMFTHASGSTATSHVCQPMLSPSLQLPHSCVNPCFLHLCSYLTRVSTHAFSISTATSHLCQPIHSSSQQLPHTCVNPCILHLCSYLTRVSTYSFFISAATSHVCQPIHSSSLQLPHGHL